MAPVVKTAYRNRRLACYTPFVLVTIYICRSRGSTNAIVAKKVHAQTKKTGSRREHDKKVAVNKFKRLFVITSPTPVFLLGRNLFLL